MNSYMFLIVPALFFIMMGIAFNGTLTNTGIATQINRINCPMPATSGIFNSSNGFVYKNGTYNYPNVNNRTITFTCSPIHTLNGIDYFYGQPAVAIGVFFFVDDWLSEGMDKILAIVTLIGLNLIPPSSLPPAVTNIVFFFIYIPMYIMIAVGLYGVFSPFKG